MRDIAKALDVSVATVSYVLNHSEKEKISHETRIKVMETAKKMGYVPNLSARSLASKRSNLIGIIINIGKNASRFKKDRYYDLAMELQQQLSKKGYDTIVSITEEIRQRDLEIASKRLLEAVFVIDIDEKYLQEVTCHTYVPVIFLECILEKEFFYQIVPDYKLVMQRAKTYLEEENLFIIMDDLLNSKAIKILTENIASENILISRSSREIKEFLKEHQNQKGIIIGETLGMEAERYIDNTQFVVLTEYAEESGLLPTTKRLTITNKHKAEVAVDIMNQLMNLAYDEQKGTCILLQPQM